MNKLVKSYSDVPGPGSTPPRRLRKLVLGSGFVALISLLGVQIASAESLFPVGTHNHSDHDHGDIIGANNEPLHAQPAAPPVPSAVGQSNGRAWSTVTYPNKRGHLCVDLTIEDVAGVPGACFDPKSANDVIITGRTVAKDGSLMSFTFGRTGGGTPGILMKAVFAKSGAVSANAGVNGVFALLGEGELETPPTRG